MRIILTVTLVLTLANTASAQHSAMPPGMSHEEHLEQLEKDAAMKARGSLPAEASARRWAQAMGFDQDATTHHFRLTAEGGAIEVGVNDGADRTNRDAIRGHLKEIAATFAAGVFEKPFATHAELPPGAAAMQRLRASITYRYEESRTGGRVRIVATSREALDAVHAFLRYQITEHKTGDPLTITK